MSRQTPIPRVPSALPGVPCVLCVVPFDATHEGGITVRAPGCTNAEDAEDAEDRGVTKEGLNDSGSDPNPAGSLGAPRCAL